MKKKILATMDHLKQSNPLWKAGALLISIERNRKYNANKLIRGNVKFKDIHKGKRCFILGNGPSLNNVDFRQLADEIVFTTNCLMEDKRFYELRSNYHVWMDLNGFGLSPEIESHYDDYISYMKCLYNCRDLTFFVPVQAREIIKKEEIDRNINVAYLSTTRHYKTFNNIRLNSLSFGFSTVVQYAIEIAIYMGFDEIYLLGCDTTIIKHNIEVALGEKMSKIHAYDEKDDYQESVLKSLQKQDGFIFVLEDTLNVFRGYSLLYELSHSKGIRLINLSNPTLLDCIPHGNLSEILIRKP